MRLDLSGAMSAHGSVQHPGLEVRAVSPEEVTSNLRKKEWEDLNILLCIHAATGGQVLVYDFIPTGLTVGI